MGEFSLTVVNLTPHTVNLLISGDRIRLPRGGKIPRIEETMKHDGDIDGVSVYTIEYGAVTNAPPIIPGTIYIVSKMIVEALPGRNDLFFPIMLERDGQGNVHAARGLGHV